MLEKVMQNGRPKIDKMSALGGHLGENALEGPVFGPTFWPAEGGGGKLPCWQGLDSHSLDAMHTLAGCGGFSIGKKWTKNQKNCDFGVPMAVRTVIWGRPGEMRGTIK